MLQYLNVIKTKLNYGWTYKILDINTAHIFARVFINLIVSITNVHHNYKDLV